ncbi:ABC transporter ATP-binding protein, partial [Micrococcus sp. SIMBA_144]
VHSFIRDLADRGVAVVLTTHDLTEAEELSDEVVVIDRGRIIAQGAPEELRSASAGSRALTIRLDSPVPAALVARLTELGPASAQGSLIIID